MKYAMRKQSGHAAMLFAIMIPALFGVFMLGSDGARALQTKARLEEASEAAVLAVSAKDEQDHQLAERYIQHYLYDTVSVTDIKVQKLACDDMPECIAATERGEARYFEYRVAGRTQHQSWFPGTDVISGFGESFHATGSSKARRYQSQPIDITFIVDFSESMNDKWSGGRHSKLRDLKDIIQDVTNELGAYNELYPEHPHRVALTGYNRRTTNKDEDGKPVVRDQRIISSMGDIDKEDKVNFNKTIDQQFVVKGKAGRIPNANEDASFYDIYFTTKFSSFTSQMRQFEAGGGTASLQGIIRAGQIVTKLAKNQKQLIIILSDREDWNHYAGQTKKLVDKGMCSNILNMVNGGTVTADNEGDNISVVGGVSQGMKTPEGEPMNARMAVIGFDYELNQNVGLRNCVGRDNVYKAENKDDILNKILGLITEEVGHLAQ